MKSSKSVRTAFVAVSAVMFMSTSAFADSLRYGKDVFNTPPIGGWTQILLGLVELSVAKAVWPNMTAEDQSLRSAQARLTETEHLPTSSMQKDAMIEEIMVDSENYTFSTVTGKSGDLEDAARTKLARIKGYEVVDAAEKAQRLAFAQEEVAKATERALLTAQSRGFIRSGVRIARAGTTILLYGDILARIYIWNVLDADPTFSPLATLTIQNVQNTLGK